MPKKMKILIFLLLICFLLALYLILTSESADLSGNAALKHEQSGIVGVEEDYRIKAKALFASFGALAYKAGFTEENVAELKSKLLDLKVPLKFKELHVKFVLALAGIEDSLKQKNDAWKSESLRAANRLQADYGWLRD